MRWKTLDLDDPNHRAQRNAMVERIDSFWEHFARDAGAIRGVFDRTSELDLPQWMATSLGTIDERIMWEFGPAVRGPGHRLVLTPESARTLRPLVDTLVERAPQFEGSQNRWRWQSRR